MMISYVDKIVEHAPPPGAGEGRVPGGARQSVPARWRSTATRGTSRASTAATGPRGSTIPTMAENPQAPVLYWVGCAASYDDRAKKIARATAKLLKAAGVDFAILGQEETCTGDPARRAGNEYLFAMLAEQNVATLNGYKEQGGIRKIVTTCPHCFNTLEERVPRLRREVRGRAPHRLPARPGRREEARPAASRSRARSPSTTPATSAATTTSTSTPRDILKSIPGVQLVEAEGVEPAEEGPVLRRRRRADVDGGAEQGPRERQADACQLLQTEAKTIATACPFCQTMITDGLKDQSKEESIRQLDVVELLEESCALDRSAGSRSDRRPGRRRDGRVRQRLIPPNSVTIAR